LLREIQAQIKEGEAKIHKEIDDLFIMMMNQQLVEDEHSQSIKTTEEYFNSLFQLEYLEKKYNLKKYENRLEKRASKQGKKKVNLRIKKIVEQIIADECENEEMVENEPQENISFEEFKKRLVCESKFRRMEQLPDEGILVRKKMLTIPVFRNHERRELGLQPERRFQGFKVLPLGPKRGRSDTN
jgi:hypothetical protein